MEIGNERAQGNENEEDKEVLGNTLPNSSVNSAGQLHTNTGMTYGSSSHSSPPYGAL